LKLAVNYFGESFVMRAFFAIAALMAATTVAVAQPKVSGGGTPPAGATPQVQTATDEKTATAPATNKGSTAKKALKALKGNDKNAKPGDSPR
jgi:biopolymer transport protein ExbD